MKKNLIAAIGAGVIGINLSSLCLAQSTTCPTDPTEVTPTTWYQVSCLDKNLVTLDNFKGAIAVPWSGLYAYQCLYVKPNIVGKLACRIQQAQTYISRDQIFLEGSPNWEPDGSGNWQCTADKSPKTCETQA